MSIHNNFVPDTDLHIDGIKFAGFSYENSVSLGNECYKLSTDNGMIIFQADCENDNQIIKYMHELEIPQSVNMSPGGIIMNMQKAKIPICLTGKLDKYFLDKLKTNIKHYPDMYEREWIDNDDRILIIEHKKNTYVFKEFAYANIVTISNNMYLIPTKETLITMFVCGNFLRLQFFAKTIEIKLPHIRTLRFFEKCGIFSNIIKARNLAIPIST
jgi:hypothetical protein